MPTNFLDCINVISVKTGIKFQKEFINTQPGEVTETCEDETKVNSVI